MTLELRDIGKEVGGESHLAEVNLILPPGDFNILLGPTLSGKTTLMRIMAGLERPGRGRVFMRGKDATGVPAEKRNAAMVHQQFINYPSWTVFENIASPLRAAKRPESEVKKRAGEAAELLKLSPLLSRRPRELSGGQQQRVALARALVKRASLTLLDEPLVNLDYKLREELREELPRLFADNDGVVVYATTEPGEALMLGGNTATLREGRVTQFGKTPEVYRRPANLFAARIFSDPPLNEARVVKRGDSLQSGALRFPAVGNLAQLADGEYIVAFRAHHLSLLNGRDTSESGSDSAPGSKTMARFSGEVLIAEISGSESFLHARVDGRDWVSQARGAVEMAAGSRAEFAADPRRFLVFHPDGSLATPPEPGDSAIG